MDLHMNLSSSHSSSRPHAHGRSAGVPSAPMAIPVVMALALLLAGCGATRTPYVAPSVELPAQWSQAGTPTQPTQPDGAAQTAAADRWWTRFGDAPLSALVDAAFVRNNDLAVAALKVRQARLEAGLAESNERPTISASVSSQRQRSFGRPHDATGSQAASVSVSYEVDLWGRLASLSDAARWEAEATEQDRLSTAATLAGTVAGLYWQLGYLNQRIASGEASVAYAERTRQLVDAQYQAGAVSALETGEAEKNVVSQRATLSALQQQRVEARNALAILFDAAPTPAALATTLPAEPQRLPTQPLPEVAAGLPAELLARRPDLRAAELRLRETLADADATRASYYPALTLTGALGGASTALGSVLANPYGLLGAGLTLPFLQVDRMKLNNAIAQVQYRSAVTSFRQTLYSALSDVENALSARTELARQGALLAEALAASRRIEQLYEVRYRNGAVALSVWLDAQESRRSAEVAWAENRLSQLTNQATLYKAMGGAV